jgi:hypothetical protein
MLKVFMTDRKYTLRYTVAGELRLVPRHMTVEIHGNMILPVI